MNYLNCAVLVIVNSGTCYKSMILYLSTLLSSWNEFVRHKLFCILDLIHAVIVRSISNEKKDGVILKTMNFKMKEMENLNKSDESENMSLDRSVSFKNWKSDKSKIVSSEFLCSICLNGKLDEPIQIIKPTILLPEPSIMFSPRPTTELDAAAIKLQKVYKSYRTRRNLADCAVVVEELWWQALDFAALRRSSFFNAEKHESASSRWGRARTRAAKVGKGLSKDEKAQKLALQHWLEAIDPRHRYGHNLHFYYDMWFDTKSTQPFFYWLDVGDGKEVIIGKCPRIDLHSQCIEYLGPSERKAYEVIVESGKLIFNQNGMLVNTVEGSKWIFVLSTSRALYVGKKKKGMFHHSSFLSGGAITAAGRLVAHDGVLEAIWPYSGHYHPTEENFKEFISFLVENHVDLTNVKRCATDEDQPSSPVTCKESKLPEALEVIHSSAALSNTNVSNHDTTACQEESMSTNAANVEAPVVFDLVKPLSCKWTSGVGPRIGCVRDYPTELQKKALEQVNLAAKATADAVAKRVPIPSPRPIPKIRVSPRLAYIGLPTPRVSFTCVN